MVGLFSLIVHNFLFSFCKVVDIASKNDLVYWISLVDWFKTALKRLSILVFLRFVNIFHIFWKTVLWLKLRLAFVFGSGYWLILFLLYHLTFYDLVWGLYLNWCRNGQWLFRSFGNPNSLIDELSSRYPSPDDVNMKNQKYGNCQPGANHNNGTNDRYYRSCTG